MIHRDSYYLYEIITAADAAEWIHDALGFSGDHCGLAYETSQHEGDTVTVSVKRCHNFKYGPPQTFRIQIIPVG